VKEEVNRLLDAKFIRLGRYADWISNIVPSEKIGTKSFVFSLTLEILIEVLLKINILCLLPIFLLILHRVHSLVLYITRAYIQDLEKIVTSSTIVDIANVITRN
jgi:hypothetical protein